jgi:hypothetical protein
VLTLGVERLHSPAGLPDLRPEVQSGQLRRAPVLDLPVVQRRSTSETLGVGGDHGWRFTVWLPGTTANGIVTLEAWKRTESNTDARTTGSEWGG